MTEAEIEKQAEEYTEENGEKYNAHLSSKRMIYLSFQAGAKWGMEHQWHDLRKNPRDLPKVKGEYRAYIYDSGLKKNRTVNLNYWGHSWDGLIEVIAWCELPQFKE